MCESKKNRSQSLIIQDTEKLLTIKVWNIHESSKRIMS